MRHEISSLDALRYLCAFDHRRFALSHRNGFLLEDDLLRIGIIPVCVACHAVSQGALRDVLLLAFHKTVSLYITLIANALLQLLLSPLQRLVLSDCLDALA